MDATASERQAIVSEQSVPGDTITAAAPQMQFGIMTVSDITQDPTTGHTPSEAERIQASVTIAKHAEEVGLDVFALG